MLMQLGLLTPGIEYGPACGSAFGEVGRIHETNGLHPKMDGWNTSFRMAKTYLQMFTSIS